VPPFLLPDPLITPLHSQIKRDHRVLNRSFRRRRRSYFPISERKRSGRETKSKDQLEMSMKKIIGSALVALALIGSVATASAAPSYDPDNFPGPQSSLSETLNFWAQFGDDNS
jgi:hypothetical protein